MTKRTTAALLLAPARYRGGGILPISTVHPHIWPSSQTGSRASASLPRRLLWYRHLPHAPMSDRSNLFGEIRRMARTSGAVGGIAARVAGERVFGIKTDRAAHAEDLRTSWAASRDR